MKAPVAILLAAAALAACGDEPERPALSPSGLLVTIYPEGKDQGPIRTRRVECADVAACRRRLAPVPAGTICTKIYGGPAEATVKGTLAGRPVDARFSLASGCEIDRWKRASALLGDPPG